MPAAFVPAIDPASMPIKPRNRGTSVPQIAVAGCGAWGRNLVRVFSGLGCLRAVCEPTPMGIETARQIAPQVPVLSEFDAVLSDPAIEGVVLATPAQTHASLARRALTAGKHVFVEKPLALTYRDGLQLVQQAHSQGLILMVGHILEYHPAVVELVRRVRGGELGAVQYIYSNRLNLGKVRREENILWSFAPHDIAVMLRLVGDHPIEVTSTGGTYLQPNIVDVTVTNLLFERGVRGHIFVSWLHPFKEQKLVVVGSRRMAVFNDLSADRKLEIHDQGIDWVNGEPTPRKRDAEVVQVSADEPLKREAEQFLHSITTGTVPLTDGRSGLAVLHVLQAAQRSLSLHGQPVALPSGLADWERL
jgi:predicted dehydrogenase